MQNLLTYKQRNSTEIYICICPTFTRGGRQHRSLEAVRHCIRSETLSVFMLFNVVRGTNQAIRNPAVKMGYLNVHPPEKRKYVAAFRTGRRLPAPRINGAVFAIWRLIANGISDRLYRKDSFSIIETALRKKRQHLGSNSELQKAVSTGTTFQGQSVKQGTWPERDSSWAQKLYVCIRKITIHWSARQPNNCRPCFKCGYQVQRSLPLSKTGPKSHTLCNKKNYHLTITYKPSRTQPFKPEVKSAASIKTQNDKVKVRKSIIVFRWSGNIVHPIAWLSPPTRRVTHSTNTAKLLTAANAMDWVTCLKLFFEKCVWL